MAVVYRMLAAITVVQRVVDSLIFHGHVFHSYLIFVTMFADSFQALIHHWQSIVNLGRLHTISRDVEQDLLLNCICLLWTEIEISFSNLFINVLCHHVLNSLIYISRRIASIFLGSNGRLR